MFITSECHHQLVPFPSSPILPFRMLRLSVLLGLLSLVSIVHSQQCAGGIPAAEVKGFLDAHNKLRQSISAGTYVAKGKKMPAAKTPIPNLVQLQRIT